MAYTTSADKDVFYYWTSDSTSSTTTPTSDVWYEWHTTDNVTGATTCSTVNDNIWESWHTGDQYKIRYEVKETHMPYKVITSPKKSSEEKRAVAAQRDINKTWRDLRIQEEKERKERAELTAQELLLDLIGEQELAHYRETGRLLVRGRKYDYVIKKAGGVYQVEKGKVIDLCIHLREQYKYPDTDNVIGILLMIKVQEQVFLKTANSHGELRNDTIKDEILRLVEKAA